ncbi:MAG TPA: putative zinc-binding metallopeptidase [Acidobacteriota bacterium]|nr:putative zinc-binding metallopeptidase [Acidobacteriota bacterium]
MQKRKTRELLYSPDTLKFEILHTAVNKLGLALKGTLIDEAIRRVREDMARVGITQLNPNFYLSNSYGCVAGTTNIAVGFYDCSEYLRQLNKEIRNWLYDPADILQIIRHEVGHAFCYAYKLYRTKEFRRLFKVKGHFFNTYTEHLGGRANPWSADFVNPAGDYYAQKHPDEDFAETFSVWLTPEVDWQDQFRSKPGALKKLSYVERVVSDFGRQGTLLNNGGSNTLDMPVEQLSMTVAQFLGAKTAQMKTYRRRATSYVDGDLRELFQGSPRNLPLHRFRREYRRGARFLRTYKRLLINRVSYWVGVEDFVVSDLIDKLAIRARATERFLKLADSEKKLIEVTAYLTTLCRNYRDVEQYFRRQ